MKKLLEITSWVLFFIAAIAGLAAVLFTVAGAVALLAFICGFWSVTIIAYCAVGYFVAITVMFIIYLLVCAYRSIEKVVNRS